MALIGTRKSTIDRRRGRWPVWLERLKKAGIALGVVVFVVWVGAWLHFSGSFGRAGNWIDQKTLEITANMGFTVENILVEGREHSDPEILRAIINVEKGDPLFSFNPRDAKDMVEKMAWVKAAHVERRLPDTIYIGIEERKPLALWQKDKQLKLIDEGGEVIATEKLKRFKDLIIVIGEDAPAHASELLGNLSAEPGLKGHVKAAHWVDGRRWDLITGENMEVKLPETDIGLALRRLATAQEEDGLLEKDILGIDLREPDRIVVRTRPGAVQEYKAGLKTGNNI